MGVKKEHLTVNDYSRPDRPLKGVKGLVLHWTAAPRQSAAGVRTWFEGRKDGENGYGSAHYIVGLKGEVLEVIPPDEMAYHVGSQTYTRYAVKKYGSYPNNCTLGIEMCVLDSEGSYADETWDAAVGLAADLCGQFDLDPFRDITTHKAIVGWKDCPKWFVDQPSELDFFKESVKEEM